MYSAHKFIVPLPSRPAFAFRLFLSDKYRNVEVPTSSINVHISSSHKCGTEIEFVKYVESKNARCTNPFMKEVACDLGARQVLPADGKGSYPELSDDDKNVQGNSNP